MKEKRIDHDEENNKGERSFKKGILAYDDDSKQTLFRFSGIELTAPKGLKNPRIVYISFILINFFLLIILKNFILN